MRLIDANALRAKICAACEERLACTDMGNICFEVACIDNAPIIEADPVRRGRWVLTRDDQYEYCCCSECGYDTEENWMIGSEIKYCAGCGARMDGDENGRTD